MKANILVCIILMGIGANFQNCSRPHFETKQLVPTDKVRSKTMFGKNPGDILTPGSDPTSCKNSKAVHVAFDFECSNSRSERFGSNLILARAVKIIILKKTTGVKICEISGDFRTEILNTKMLSFVPCARLSGGIYSAYIVDAKSTATNYAQASLTRMDIAFRVNNKGYACLTRKGRIGLLYDFNVLDERYNEYVKSYGSHSNNATQVKCDSRASSLITAFQ